MKYTLFRNSQNNMGLVNIGDHIQSCAAEQYFPQIDFYVERDNLNEPDIEKAKIIMNGWFTESPENWPPNPNLVPLFVSFHLQPSKAAVFFSNPDTIKYLKKNEPIGCRDYRTVTLLEQAGIKAYFSLCLTTTLDLKYKSTTTNDEILLVDPLYSYDASLMRKVNLKELARTITWKKLKKVKDYFGPKTELTEFIPKEVIDKSHYIQHYISNKNSVEDLYGIAKGLLKRYSEAKLVVTSRIHCALPCIALGTPVLFVLDGLSDESQHMSRFRGILDHINILTNDDKTAIDKAFGKKMNTFHPSEIDWDNPPQNPNSHKDLANKLKLKCAEFVES